MEVLVFFLVCNSDLFLRTFCLVCTGSKAQGGGQIQGLGASFAGSLQPSLGGIGATKDGILGSASSPIHMVTSEGGFKQQFWRTVRTLGLAFLMVSAIGALFEDRGIGKGWICFFLWDQMWLCGNQELSTCALQGKGSNY